MRRAAGGPRLDAARPAGVYWVARTAARDEEEQPVGDRQIKTPCLFRRARGDRYFGGLWFKVFSERGPCPA